MAAPTVPLLLDTDVLIDYLRGRAEAVDYFRLYAQLGFGSPIGATAGREEGKRQGAKGKSRFIFAFCLLPS